MKLSVVIPAFNEEKLLGATLESIRAAGAAFDAAGWNWEIVVCDNNSTDRTGTIARDAGARVVIEPVNQIARARNTGAAAATGEWILFIDADSHPSRGLFEELTEVIESGTTVAGGCTLKLDTNRRVARLTARVWNQVSRIWKFAAGSFIFVEAAAFRAIGGFSLELYASEEIDLSKRLKRLARKQGRAITILHKNPLLTSARKMHLYTHREHLRFLWQTLLTGGRNMKDRNACPAWYDGRR